MNSLMCDCNAFDVSGVRKLVSRNNQGIFKLAYNKTIYFQNIAAEKPHVIPFIVSVSTIKHIIQQLHFQYFHNSLSYWS